MKKVGMCFYFDSCLVDDLNAYCKKHNVTKTQVIRQ